MTSQISLGQLAHEIRQIYGSVSSKAETLIDTHLEQRLRAFTADKKIGLLEELTNEFSRTPPESSDYERVRQEVVSKLFPFLLGKKVSQEDLESKEFLQKLAESLNTIFDNLNRLISVINMTLCPGFESEKTIRGIIGDRLKGEKQSRTLESYLGQIKKAFSISQRAFQEAVYKKANDILLKLDPEKMEATPEKGWKFGPFREAEHFELYKDEFRKFRKWVESGRLSEEFQREFESQCRKLYREEDTT